MDKINLPNYFGFYGLNRRVARLDWRFYFSKSKENHLFNMAEGYFEVARELIASCISDDCSKKADIWIFPILFNIVHGIELYLKGFNSLYPIYVNLQEDKELQKSKIEGGHNIRQLCEVAIKKLTNNNNIELLGEFELVQQFINILYANTNDMTFMRYPIDKKKDVHFYVEANENIMIDLDILQQWVLKVFEILDNSTGYISTKFFK